MYVGFAGACIVTPWFRARLRRNLVREIAYGGFSAVPVIRFPLPFIRNDRSKTINVYPVRGVILRGVTPLPLVLSLSLSLSFSLTHTTTPPASFVSYRRNIQREYIVHTPRHRAATE